MDLCSPPRACPATTPLTPDPEPELAEGSGEPAVDAAGEQVPAVVMPADDEIARRAGQLGSPQ